MQLLVGPLNDGVCEILRPTTLRVPFDQQFSFNNDRAHGFEQLGQLLCGRLAIGTADHQPATLLRLQESRRLTGIRR
ncbi:MAG: hypothetical protein ACKOJG_02930, partial [Actinomycetota bacterium]